MKKIAEVIKLARTFGMKILGDTELAFSLKQGSNNHVQCFDLL